MSTKDDIFLINFGPVMHFMSQFFLKYFKSESKILSRSSKLNFNISFDRIFFNLILPASILGEKVADFSDQSSRHVLSVVGVC